MIKKSYIILRAIIKRSLILLILVIQLSSCTSDKKICTINGEIVNRPNDTLLLFKASMFPIIEAKIPITNNKFHYSFEFSQSEAFELVFKEEYESGSMSIIDFFSEKDEIQFILHEREKKENNKIKGYKYNNALKEYNLNLKELFWDEIMKYSDSLGKLYKNKMALSEDWNNLQEQLKSTTDKEKKKQLYNKQTYLKNTKEMFTPQARKYSQIQDSIIKEKKLWEFNYIKTNTTILSFYQFMSNIKETAKACCWKPVDIELINEAQENLNRFSLEFPNHPYNTIVKNTLNGLQNIHEGGKFIDFELPNIKDENIVLSKIIKKNKLTLLDFWSTWCSPCIKTSRELIPVYNEFKDKGFEVLGITQNYREMDKLLRFIQNENYPWTNVIDINNKAGVWDKYSLSQAGGATFLVNSSGKIIGVNLTTDKIKEKLIEYLN